MKGVNSFSGYVTFCLEEMMRKDETFSKFTPKIEMVSVDDTRVILNDLVKVRIVEVKFVENTLCCMLCDQQECKHVGFCESMPEVIEILGMRMRPCRRGEKNE